MIVVPEEIKKILLVDTTRKNIRISFPNDNIDDICNDRLVSETFSFTESICSQLDVKFGLCEASAISFECFDVPNIKGKMINAQIEIDITPLGSDFIDKYGQTSDDVEFPFFVIPYGEFIVDSCKRELGALQHRTVQAYSSTAYYDWKKPQNTFNKVKMEFITDKNEPIEQNIDCYIMSEFPELAFEFLDKEEYTSYEETKNNVKLVEAIRGFFEGFPVTQEEFLYGDDNSRYKISLRFTADALWPIDNAAGVKRHYDSLPKNEIIDKLFGVEFVELPRDFENVVENEVQKVINLLHEKGTTEYDQYLNVENIINQIKKQFEQVHQLYRYELYRILSNAYSIKEIDERRVNRYVVYPYANSYTEHPQGTIKYQTGLRDSILSAPKGFSFYITLPEIFSYNTDVVSFGIPKFYAFDTSSLSNRIFTLERAEFYVQYKGTATKPINFFKDFKDATEGFLELYGAFGKFDRREGLVPKYLKRMGMVFPSSSLFPSDSVYPMYYEPGLFVNGDLHYRCWFDDEHSRKYRSVFCTYTDKDTLTEEYAEYEIIEVEEDENLYDYQSYEVADNYFLKEASYSRAEIMAILERVGNQLKDLYFMPYDAEMIGVPYLEAGDAIEFKTINGSFYSFIFRRELKGIQALTDTLTGN